MLSDSQEHQGRTSRNAAKSPEIARTAVPGRRVRGSCEKNRKSGGLASHSGAGQTVIGVMERVLPSLARPPFTGAARTPGQRRPPPSQQTQLSRELDR